MVTRTLLSGTRTKISTNLPSKKGALSYGLTGFAVAIPIISILLLNSIAFSDQRVWASANLTNTDLDHVVNTYPNWSPDGSKIAFESNRDGNFEIYVMNAADGGNVTRLTNNTTGDFDPNWSPDGSKIAFSSDRDGNFEIYVMNAADGGNVTRLTFNDAIDEFPNWSPDGSKIAFSSNRDGNNEIYVMNAADGSNQTRLTNVSEISVMPNSTATTEPSPTVN
jgi:Tol biopolymer transport system component